MDFISKVAIFVLLFESTFCIAIVDDYKLNLTSSGPAVRGSYINFQAQLFLGASKTHKDENLFRYDWRDTVYLLTESQRANFNTSYEPCFDSMVEPKTYKMIVSVYDAKRKSIFSPVTRKDIDFRITSTLNGNLKHDQKVHRGLRAPNNTFSTQKPVNFTANLTDIFMLQPTFTYKWLIDDKEFEAENINNISIPFKEPGTYTVKLEVVATEIAVDCRGDEYLDRPKGSFKTEIILKDPVLHFKLDGRTNISVGQNLNLTTNFSGSPPYTFCWKIRHAAHSKELHRMCYNETNKSEYNISVPEKKISSPGKYFLSIYIENDVSVLSKMHFVTVHNAPVPAPSSHSAAYVLVPVISALVVVSLFVFGGVYFSNYRKRKDTHIEHADFQFHSSIQRTSNDGWFLSNVKGILRGIFSPHNEKMNVRDRRQRLEIRRGYGTMVDPKNEKPCLQIS